MSFFSGFPFGGNFPGGHGHGHSDSEQESTDNEKYYKVLGVEKGANDREIKKSYRKLARQLHPDRHPDKAEEFQAKFQELQTAYDVLSDPDKRKLYDRFGEAGLKSGGGGSGFDIFDLIGGGSRRQQRGPAKARDIVNPVDVTLEDLYRGQTKETSFTRMVKCDKCGGKGGKTIVSCSACDGRGVQIVIQRMGHMTMQTQQPCRTCHGEGQTIPEKHKCGTCKGQGMKEENKKIDVPIPLGARHAEKITLRNEGHSIPGRAQGNVVLVLRCKKHPVFKRLGADLAMEHTVTLREALCGYRIVIPHLSGQKLILKSKQNEVVQPGIYKRIYNQGMPQRGSTHVHGHLYIKFHIKFPVSGSLNDQQLTELRQILPEDKNDEDSKMDEQKDAPQRMFDEYGEEIQEDDYHEEVEADDIEGEPDVTPYSNKTAFDEDEEEEGGVQCRQM